MAKNEELEKIMDGTGLKLYVVAERMGTTENRLWRLRQEPERMRTKTIVELAAALEVDPIKIFKAISEKELKKCKSLKSS